jgi:hypothetical protein
MHIDRRTALLAGLAGASLALSARTAQAASADAAADPTLEFVFELDATLEPPQQIGNIGIGERRIINITGGTVRGPRLNGVVLPGGADWQVIRPDGITEIHARYTLQADDGALIYIDAPGIREATPAVIARISAGELVDPSEYYFRTVPRIETSAAQYDWMNRRLFVCKGIRLPAGVNIRYYVIT